MATEIVPAPEGAGPTPTPTSFLTPLSSALDSAGSPAELAAVFDGLAAESGRLMTSAPSGPLAEFWSAVHEHAFDEAQQVRTPSRLRRRWSR